MYLQFIRNTIDTHSQVQYFGSMIYCVCNSINTAKVDMAVSNGARSAKCVLAHHGKKFNCGQCVNSIKERLGQLNDATQLQAAE